MNNQSVISSHLDKKPFIYGFVGLLAGSAFTALLMISNTNSLNSGYR